MYLTFWLLFFYTYKPLYCKWTQCLFKNQLLYRSQRANGNGNGYITDNNLDARQQQYYYKIIRLIQ